jgi:hypothetical protein
LVTVSVTTVVSVTVSVTVTVSVYVTVIVVIFFSKTAEGMIKYYETHSVHHAADDYGAHCTGNT